MRNLSTFILLSVLSLSVAQADGHATGQFRVVGVVKKLDDGAVVLRVNQRNVRISKRFFEDQANLTVGEVATAHYTMTFKESSSRTPTSN